jgi:malate dehydrogenase (oxaloacetate-decarboxylating)(NADP+)
MMVKMGHADAQVSGITHEYPDVIRPALQIFGTRAGASIVCGLYIMIVDDDVYLFTDTTVNIEPDSETLCEIAILAHDFAETLGIDPRIAMLSFSNFGSTPHEAAQKVSNAVELVRNRRPDIVVDGEMQADTAVVEALIEERYPFSVVKNANVLVFPNLGWSRVSVNSAAMAARRSTSATEPEAWKTSCRVPGGCFFRSRRESGRISKLPDG